MQADNQARCPLCDTSLVQVKLRRSLLWALVVEMWMVAGVLATVRLSHG